MSSTTNSPLRGQTALSVIALVLISLAVSTGCKLGANRHNSIGCQAYNQGQITTAIAEFNKAIEMDPNDADAIYNLGASYYALGKQTKNLQATQSAEQLYRRTIAIDDQHASVALLSFAKYGYYDLGVNRRRVQRILYGLSSFEQQCGVNKP